MLTLTHDLAQRYPGAAVGLLAMHDVVNAAAHEKLDEIRGEIERSLREKYGAMSRNALKALYPMDVYVAYYKAFGYSYHVLSQVESIMKGKLIPNVSSLVEAMFMAELKNMLLTAGHDLDKLAEPLLLALSTGEECFTALSGKEVSTVVGDMMISDSEGVISSILRGPDARTSIGPKTTRVLYVVYAPPTIEDSVLYSHLDDIESYVRLLGEPVMDFKHVLRAAR